MTHNLILKFFNFFSKETFLSEAKTIFIQLLSAYSLLSVGQEHLRN